MPPAIARFPPGRVIHRLASPAVVTPPPAVIHPELMAPALLQGLTALWHATQPARFVEFHSLKNVYVVGEGLVFDRTLALLAPSLTQTPAPVVEQAHATLKAAIDAGTIQSHPETLLLCGKAGLNNYGHWLVEMLPCAHLAARWIAQDGWRVLVPQVYPWMAAPIADSLDLLGVPADRRILAAGEPRHATELVFVDGLTRHGQFYSPLVLKALDHIAAQIPAAPHAKLWISREDSSRRLQDEALANERIAAAGWHVVHPGRIPFRDQVALARGARHMAGINGAGLANLAFMQPGGTLTSIVPATMPDVFFWQLAGHRGLAYQEVRSAIVAGQGGPTTWDGPLSIPIDEVLAHLHAIAAD